MAVIQDLLKRVADAELRARLEEEIGRLTKHKKFGLVFEEHLPECTPLYDVKIKRGMTVATKQADCGALFVVKSIKDGIAECVPVGEGDASSFDIDELVAVARFGDPIYPCLKKIDSIDNGGGDLWHTLIQADNYHALQLLEYLYPGKVDCIYIDPPYNTGAKDWKYNNDYVDSSDSWRHSKWLSMMEKRLALAKKLLNPKDSVLIVTIDEKEYLHLGMLLEQMFPEARIQMVSSVINPAGAGRQNELARTDEYIYLIMLGACQMLPESRDMDKVPIVWDTLRRSDLASRRGTSKGGTAQFYPIYVENATGRIADVGDPISPNVNKDEVPEVPGCTAVFPIRDNGIEMNWGLTPDEAKKRWKLGYVRAGKYLPDKPQKYVIQYVTGGVIEDIECGKAIVEGRRDDGSVIAYHPTGRDKMPTTNWNRPAHDAQRYGTGIVKAILNEGRFTFPKSLYAVRDVIRLFVAEKPNSIILDFFAGSGTTLHAVNLLNAEDGGNRRCILVTNNEVSAKEEDTFRAKGLRPGDAEWEKFGIAQYVTWPRTKCSILGVNVKGEPLEGNYGAEVDDYMLDEDAVLVSKKTKKQIKRNVYTKTKRQVYSGLSEMRMADGFKSNAAFFKLGFVDPSAVSIGRAFKEILPLLWLKAGAHGACPKAVCPDDMLVCPENRFAVLMDECYFASFAKEVKQHPEIETLYFVTDYERSYKAMAARFPDKTPYQLYTDYLENFRVNRERK